MTLQGMDYSWSRPPVDLVDVVFRYLGNSGASLNAQEVADIHAKGKAIAPTFEQAADQAFRGGAQGAADAQYANSHADALGVPADVWVWFAVDTAATYGQIFPYFQALKATSKRPVGMYGPLGPALQLMDEGVIRGVWAANAASWSGYKTWVGMADAVRASHAHVLQHLDHPLLGVDPLAYDYDEILVPFPTWGPHGTVTPTPPVPMEDDVPKPTDCVDVLTNQWGRWHLHADGGVFTKSGKFYGSYPGLPADRRLGDRYFVSMTNRADGKEGYCCVANDDSEYNFPA